MTFLVMGIAFVPAQDKKSPPKPSVPAAPVSPATPAVPVVPAVDENTIVLKDSGNGVEGGAERAVATFGLWGFY